jgi:uncharacterized protein (TIGR03437 family)
VGAIALASGGNTTLIVVSLTATNDPNLDVSDDQLTFYYQLGALVPGAQTVALTSTGSVLAFTAAATTTDAGTWLKITPASGSTAADLSVSVDPKGLKAGTYTGKITIDAAEAANTPEVIDVQLVVTAKPLLQADHQQLSFDYLTGNQAPASQTLHLTSSGANFSFAVSGSTTSGGNWLLLPTRGTTPGDISVGINPTGLSPGTYTGKVTFTSADAGNSPQAVPVTLKVSALNPFSVFPAELSFAFQTSHALPPNQSIALSATGVPVNFTATASVTGSGPKWLSVSPSSGTTPATLAVAVNPATLEPGSYSGSITISAGDVVLATVPVKLLVANTPLLSIAPASASFSVPEGTVFTSLAKVNLTSTDAATAMPFTLDWKTANGGNWLLVSPLALATPAEVDIFGNAAGLPPGVYAGTITVTSSAASNSPQTIPVQLTIVSNNKAAVTPASLSFAQTVNGTPAAPQQLAVSTTTGALPFTTAAATTSGGNWLSVNPATGTTPGAVTVSVNAAGLAAGTYKGSVNISVPGAGNSLLTVPVTLVLSAAAQLNVSPASLKFTAQVGAAGPPAQPLLVSAGSTGNLNFSAAATTAAGGNWLSVSPGGGATPATLNVSVNPSGLQAGTYTGTVSISSSGASNSPQTVAVTLQVAPAFVTPVVSTIENAASLAPTAVSPGLIVSVFGTGIGPAKPATLHVTNGTVDSELAGTRVLFDGVPAPLTYVSSTQINAVVPYEIAGRFSTKLEVEFQGARSAPIDLRVESAVPSIFTLDADSKGSGNGSGQGAILNEDGTINGRLNPARKGSTVVIYATGEGQTLPGGITGKVIGTDLPKPLGKVSVTIGGQTAEVRYAGSAPTLVSGVLQVNARIPAGLTATGAVPVSITVGTATSQQGVTLAIQ